MSAPWKDVDAELLEQHRAALAAAAEIAELRRRQNAQIYGGCAPPPKPKPKIKMPPRKVRRGKVQPHELATPATFAVEADFAKVTEILRGPQLRYSRPGLCNRFVAELDRWSELLGVSPTACGILAIAHLFRGIRGAGQRGEGDGLGFQAPIRWWAFVLGRSPSTVCEAFLQLEGHRDTRWVRPPKGRGTGDRKPKANRWRETDVILARRKSNTRKVSAVTRGRDVADQLEEITGRDGTERNTINVHGVLYVTTRGARVLSELGLTRRFVPGQSGRKTKRYGLVDFLLRTLAAVLRAVAKRCASVPQDRIPEEDSKPLRSSLRGGGQGDFVENTGPPAESSARPLRGLAQPGSADTNGGDRRETGVLARWRQLRWMQIWPHIWESLTAERRADLEHELQRLRPLVTAALRRELRANAESVDAGGPPDPRVARWRLYA